MNDSQKTQQKKTGKNEKEEAKSEKKAEEPLGQLEDEKKQILELTETLQRLQAEFDNYRKRVEAEIQEKKQIAKAEVHKKLLPVLDSFEHALKENEMNKEGVERIYAQLLDTLEQDGLKAINAQGKFDPYQHEVLLTETSEQEEEAILEELQRGYTYQGKLLRTSKVKISKK